MLKRKFTAVKSILINKTYLKNDMVGNHRNQVISFNCVINVCLLNMLLCRLASYRETGHLVIRQQTNPEWRCHQ